MTQEEPDCQRCSPAVIVPTIVGEFDRVDFLGAGDLDDLSQITEALRTS